MSRSTEQRLRDILASCDAIERHLAASASDELLFDAIRVRLVEIGEAVKDLDDTVLADEPDIPWQEIARVRDHVAHRYFDTTHALVFNTAHTDIPPLRAAATRLLSRTQ